MTERLTADDIWDYLKRGAALVEGGELQEYFDGMRRVVETYGDQRAAEARKAAMEEAVEVVKQMGSDLFQTQAWTFAMDSVEEKLRQLVASPAPEVK